MGPEARRDQAHDQTPTPVSGASRGLPLVFSSGSVAPDARRRPVARMVGGISSRKVRGFFLGSFWALYSGFGVRFAFAAGRPQAGGRQPFVRERPVGQPGPDRSQGGQDRGQP